MVGVELWREKAELALTWRGCFCGSGVAISISFEIVNEILCFYGKFCDFGDLCFFRVVAMGAEWTNGMAIPPVNTAATSAVWPSAWCKRHMMIPRHGLEFDRCG